ncbi:cytoskeleton protein RodZ [Pseudomonas duriflava]|uniref:Cytoskeleton protein RodZ n=1 Tax=Pseudomonas duriflava TaxID=459528 RepID=A0A562QF99_9PSED|nr:RodZ family helix-turn-helix domain-containing protein [Pseudomonas duriflava]TWI55437.1 cytoskeleton protein RodZ [Pseudomonas duriflava]
MNHVQPEAVMSARSNPGDLLRQARTQRGWSLPQVAAQLNLSERVVEQLEAGDYKQLPGHTFARGYTRSYGKLLGLDQAELVNIFDRYTGTDAKGSTVHTINRVQEPVRLSRSVLRVVSFILVVLIIGLALFWWQERGDLHLSNGGLSLEHVEVESADGTTEIHTLDEPEDQAVADAQQPAEPVMDSSAPVASTSSESTAIAPAQQASDVSPANPNASPSNPTGALVAPPAESVTALAPVTPPASAESASAPAIKEGVLDIQLVADCWMQITNGAGKVLFSGLKRKGDSLQFENVQAPVELRLGYARGAQITYNGQPVDVKPYIRGETARFKIGQVTQ